ncbi:MAG: alpha-1,4-glucan--maltose-1-phosphate maltosyltransferase [Candidatus Omnitrophica bacterium]|nr:alpha-1,4-glucan--maltose-1-phosphate maltosyltransferase [Candidatus Omnitrophota bacterium]
MSSPKTAVKGTVPIPAVKKSVYSPRVMVEKVTPQIDGGLFPVKRVVGERVVVRANVFADGHDEVKADLFYRSVEDKDWHEVPMKALGNDGWAGSFVVDKYTDYLYSVRGYVCEFSSWCHDLKKKVDAGRDVAVDLKIGSQFLVETASRAQGAEAEKLLAWADELAKPTSMEAALKLAFSEELYKYMDEHLDLAKSVVYPKELRVSVERAKAGFSSWYEFFPRSWGATPGVHGTFKEAARILPEIARMGFDIVYLPPIHPIGKSFRKGRNNATTCTPSDPGSPWAVGSSDGGHKTVNPQLGTLADFRDFVAKARENNLEVALDIAFQCSPDHPYLKEHPSWFKWRPDGTVQYAENPPKKYEDIVPFNFDTDDREALWQELRSVFLFWIEQGVKVFRVDNPHTKPFLFWDWAITTIRKDHPDVMFLAEAFTRPNIMYRLAKGGFTHSYPYFTWRNTKKDFQDYLTELTRSEVAAFVRPNFWPNTPDILAEHLQHAARPSFVMRAVLAMTLSSNFGMYGPAFELCENVPMPGKEEYIDNEKYEIKKWDWNRPGNIKGVITKLNKIRRENPALQLTRNVRFCSISNDQLLAYCKATADCSNIIIVVVNLDPHHAQGGMLDIPLDELGIGKDWAFPVQDLLSGEQFNWQGYKNFVQLDPAKCGAHVIRISRQFAPKQDPDYFM